MFSRVTGVIQRFWSGIRVVWLACDNGIHHTWLKGHREPNWIINTSAVGDLHLMSFLAQTGPLVPNNWIGSSLSAFAVRCNAGWSTNLHQGNLKTSVSNLMRRCSLSPHVVEAETRDKTQESDEPIHHQQCNWEISGLFLPHTPIAKLPILSVLPNSVHIFSVNHF